MTSNHSIYSADRLDFVPAGELRVGETLRNLDGDVRIESIEQLGSEERVYNLEIHGEHVFRVASSGLLVHNSSGAHGSNGGAHGQTHRTHHGYSDPTSPQFHPNPHHHRRDPITGEQLRDPSTGSRTWPGEF